MSTPLQITCQVWNVLELAFPECYGISPTFLHLKLPTNWLADEVWLLAPLWSLLLHLSKALKVFGNYLGTSIT